MSSFQRLKERCKMQSFKRHVLRWPSPDNEKIWQNYMTSMFSQNLYCCRVYRKNVFINVCISKSSWKILDFFRKPCRHQRSLILWFTLIMLSNYFIVSFSLLAKCVPSAFTFDSIVTIGKASNTWQLRHIPKHAIDF